MLRSICEEIVIVVHRFHLYSSANVSSTSLLVITNFDHATNLADEMSALYLCIQIINVRFIYWMQFILSTLTKLIIPVWQIKSCIKIIFLTIYNYYYNDSKGDIPSQIIGNPTDCSPTCPYQQQRNKSCAYLALAAGIYLFGIPTENGRDLYKKNI